jgi:GNAT superfamily N-acetyltransferase
MTKPVVRLRPVSPADQSFLLCVYASTRAAELALTGWDEPTSDAFVQMQFNAQSTHYSQHWPASEHSVIEVLLQGAAQPAGRLWIDRRADAVHVLDIALLPEWCNHGIGGACLERLMDEASRAGKALTIQVEQGNPARRLYDRLGFQPVGPQLGLHQLMAWQLDAHADSLTKEACYEQA